MRSSRLSRAAVLALLPAALLSALGLPAEAVGRQIELSSLTPTLSRNGWGPVERNSSNGRGGAADGGRLTMAGRHFATGLGVHAPSDVRVTVPAACTRFTTTVGVDDEVGDRGSAVAQVYVGQAKRFDSGLLRGSGKPVPVSMPVQPGSSLRLVVTPGADGPRFDRVDWAAARFECSTEPATAVSTGTPAATAKPVSAAPRTVPAPLGVPGAWRTSFTDEFDGTGLDLHKWSDHDPWQAGGYGADSAWFPVPHSGRQLSVGGGVLTLRSRRTAGLPGGKSFTSAQINSKGKYSIPAGVTSYTEARIKAPSAAGTWPGFWLLGNGTNGDGGGWPITGEVDILEFANNKHERGSAYFSVWYPKDVYTRAPGTFLNGTHDTHPDSHPKRPHLLDSWHTWGLLRDPQRMSLFIDGQAVATFRPGQAYANAMPLPAMVFTNAQHLRLSLLVGGWGGQGLVESEFRDGDLSVDYVRVWTR